jgi:hypothetical protein
LLADERRISERDVDAGDWVWKEGASRSQGLFENIEAFADDRI